MTDTAKMKAAAEKARWGDWSAYKPHSGARGYEVRVGSEAVAQHCLKDDAAFIAEASPKTVLCLIAALEAAEKRIAELEARTVKLPSINPQMFNDDVMFGYRKAQREAVEFCAAAGINLETGGE
ncbi:ead/Ea22-like family protein [Cronobacter sakazakii]|uniref:ead/Ea22-like family protein n=1 Tax=Cronobacter sakazakii TaxID=28141 RepID=UPI0019550B6C|nr:ead/Ea22-like family protein [Cronobacter sakazakii]